MSLVQSILEVKKKEQAKGTVFKGVTLDILATYLSF